MPASRRPGLGLVAVTAAAQVIEAAERTAGIQEHSLEAVRLATEAMRDVAVQAAADAKPKRRKG